MRESANTVQSETRSGSPSRRALLAGALGGIGAWAATAMVRPGAASAGVDGDVILGAVNTATATTAINNTTTSSTNFSLNNTHAGIGLVSQSVDGYGLYGVSTSNTGVYGNSQEGTGLRGQSDSGQGVFGVSQTNVGVLGECIAGSSPGALGHQANSYTGVMGISSAGSVVLPAYKPRTGVFGYAAQTTSARGVWGESPNGIGVYGHTSSGYAGYFHGKVYTDAFHELSEVATPAAPGANRARLFVRDNGAGKTQLCVRFPTGSVKLLAQEA